MATAREQVSNLVSLYSEVLDSGDFDGIGRLFAHGAVEVFNEGISNGGRKTGTDEIVSWYRGAVSTYDGSPRTRHVISNLIVEIGAGEHNAEARTYFTVLQCLPGFPLQIVAAGRYYDRFENFHGRWRFVEKLIHADFTGDISRHYLPLKGTAEFKPGAVIPVVAA